MINVLIVEDSPSAANLIQFILSSDPEIRVAGIASDGESALRDLARLPVDVVTMDIHLPGMNGFETTRRIMETKPVPIVIVSSLIGPSKDAMNPFRVMEEGALALLGKPPGPGHPEHEKRAEELIRTVRIISEVKVFRRKASIKPLKCASGRPSANAAMATPAATVSRPAHVQTRREGRYRAVVLGASTGGPSVIEEILSRLGAGFPLPVLVVQHITPGFTEGFADWIQKSSGFPARMARQGEIPHPGTVYVAPSDVHMGISANGAIVLNPNEDPIHGMKPSVSYLFESAARVLGSRAIGVLLTGMGSDGARELGLIRKSGGITIAQESVSCVVPGMPGEAERLGSAGCVLPPEAIAKKLLSLSSE